MKKKMSEDKGDSPLLKSIRLCKGINDNTMISLTIPAYSRIPGIISYLKTYKEKLVRDLTGVFNGIADDLLDDDEKNEIKYTIMTYDEIVKFISGVEWKESDKKEIGLIVYFGYIDNGSIKDSYRKVFHTFPIPMGSVDFKFYSSDRFNIKLLNECSWFVEQFGALN